METIFLNIEHLLYELGRQMLKIDIYHLVAFGYGLFLLLELLFILVQLINCVIHWS